MAGLRTELRANTGLPAHSLAAGGGGKAACSAGAQRHPYAACLPTSLAAALRRVHVEFGQLGLVQAGASGALALARGHAGEAIGQ